MRNKPPYAPTANIHSTLSAFRRGELSGTITGDALLGVGVPFSTRGRVVDTLCFLGMIDNRGKPTKDLLRLGGVQSDDEYRVLLAALVKRAYASLFVDCDDFSELDSPSLHAAFVRCYGDSRLLRHQLSLFRGLCVAAGLVPSGKIPRRHHVWAREDAVAVIPPQERATIPRYPAIYLHVSELPLTGQWTRERHDTWLAGMVGLLDWHIQIVPV